VAGKHSGRPTGATSHHPDARLHRPATRSCTDSSGVITSTVMRRAPSRATRPANESRLVTTVAQPLPDGRSGRTWPAVAALSNITSSCRSTVRLR
jgi:hypothetical protein